MRLELLVDFAAFWRRLSADIARARRSVYVQTFAFEGDSVGTALGVALLAAKVPDVRILADSFTKHILSDKLRYAPRHLFDHELRAEHRATLKLWQDLRDAGGQLRFTNPPTLRPRSWLARNHKKLLVLDDTITYFGGINFSEHNAAWHDLMLRVEDSRIAEFAQADFAATWNGHNLLQTQQFDDLTLSTADGPHNAHAFAPVLAAIDAAQESVFVTSPYISFPFYDHLRTARERGVAVQIITPEANNWRIFSDYARWEAWRGGFDLRFYPHGMSHLKAMLLDNRTLILGSSNFDYLSYRVHQELIATLTAPEIIADFRAQVLEPDLAQARPAAIAANDIGRRLDWKMRLLSRGTRFLI